MPRCSPFHGVVLLLFAVCQSAWSQAHLETLRGFGFPGTSARQPTSPPLLASDGKLYGVTLLGGAYGEGTVFRLNTDGTGMQVLHSFTNRVDPRGRLLEGSDGALYGLTYNGGSNGVGSLFRLNKDG